MDSMYNIYYKDFCVACTTENIIQLENIYKHGFIDMDVLKLAYKRKKAVYQWCITKNIFF